METTAWSNIEDNTYPAIKKLLEGVERGIDRSKVQCTITNLLSVSIPLFTEKKKCRLQKTTPQVLQLGTEPTLIYTTLYVESKMLTPYLIHR